MDPPAADEASFSWPWRIWSWCGRVGGQALGIGDADLMMMAGAFLGWQVVIVSFFVSAFPGLVFAVAQLMIRGDRRLPFGPALSLGIVTTFLGWPWIGRAVQPLFFNATLLTILLISGFFLMILSGLLIRWLRGQPPPLEMET
ncbi:MAG: hypothetical protein KatS3mg105_0133 [Gemmatales bacterium]|nr:MAG: hypothetical protein KatS3mg105_0133 [Gemmatales bacterium]